MHDVAAGSYPGAVLGMWLARTRVAATMPSAVPALEKAAVSLWLVMAAALLLLVTTGLFRLGYYQLNLRPGYLETKRQMVLVKHAAFVTVLVLSFIWMFTLLPS